MGGRSIVQVCGACQSSRACAWDWMFPRCVDRMYTSTSPDPAEAGRHTQAILHMPRLRKGLGAWSTKVLPPSHGVQAQGAWSCVSEIAGGKTPGARK
jgi:hypothetical protein